MTADVRDVLNARDERDPELPARLLGAGREVLMPLLGECGERELARYTACPGWTVRHVVAHCSAALNRVLEDRVEEAAFTPEGNDRDIAERADWPHERLLAELERGLTGAGAAIRAAGGPLDGIAFGEWVHVGDVQDALGRPGGYGGDALPDALALLGRLTRARGLTALHADLDDQDEPVLLGAASGDAPPARFLGSGATLVRLYAGRPVVGARYELAGATERDLLIYG
ncbi:maleylpyruvate isomerase family mycothiol-dependent enzyme [Streptomyces sp. NPDC050560]|uniref:maleylpyruvate isomerase family mycothiol-dependent enzyme n=1 Tax=Streptomyces sp. NPDC050560 TaxID=3365630 RepID=UPI003790DDB1